MPAKIPAFAVAIAVPMPDGPENRIRACSFGKYGGKIKNILLQTINHMVITLPAAGA